MTPRLRSGPATWPAIAASILILSACASGTAPKAELGAAEAAVAEADRAGAAARAPVELNNARSKLQRAQDAASRNKHDEAARLAREAEVDAQLASAKSQSAAANTALTQIRQGTSTLQEEVQRQTGR
jgi:Domain of unknown function (DUF4398)